MARADWPQAITALEQALALEPGYAEVYPLLMQAAMAVKNYQLAVHLLEMAAAHAPSILPAITPFLSHFPSKRPSRSLAGEKPSGDPAHTVYQLKITLKYLSPPSWRRVLVKSNISLAKLHRIIQVVMGWHDSHLHEFETKDGRRYGVPNQETDAFWGEGPANEKNVKLFQVLSVEKQRLQYTYDFGDSWEHDILLEKILPAETGQHYPLCTAGKRTTPPEDVGGIPGYETFLEALADPQHEEHETYVDWIGGKFDPQAFDIDGVNAELRRMR